jgi:hypothetical protein
MPWGSISARNPHQAVGCQPVCGATILAGTTRDRPRGMRARYLVERFFADLTEDVIRRAVSPRPANSPREEVLRCRDLEKIQPARPGLANCRNRDTSRTPLRQRTVGANLHAIPPPSRCHHTLVARSTSQSDPPQPMGYSFLDRTRPWRRPRKEARSRLAESHRRQRS